MTKNVAERPPSPAKTKFLHEKNNIFLSLPTINFATDLLLPWFQSLGTKRQKISKKCHFFKKSTQLLKKLKKILFIFNWCDIFFYIKQLEKSWSFAWKIENRPTYGDFEKKILDPQLHEIFKPIRKFFCTFLLI